MLTSTIPTIFQNLGINYDCPVSTIAVSAGGNCLVIGGAQGIFLVNLDDPFEIFQTLLKGKNSLVSLKWSMNPFIFVAFEKNKVSVWRYTETTQSWGTTREWSPHWKDIVDLCWSPNQNSSTLATCSSDSLKIWDLKTPKPTAVRLADAGGMTIIRWNRSGTFLAGVKGGVVHIWDSNNILVARIGASKKQITSFSWSFKSDYVFGVCDGSPTFALWSAETATKCQGEGTASFPVDTIEFTPFGNSVVVYQKRHTTLLLYQTLDIKTPKLVASYSPHSKGVSKLSFRRSVILGNIEYQIVFCSENSTGIRLVNIPPKDLKECGEPVRSGDILTRRRDYTGHKASFSSRPLHVLVPITEELKTLKPSVGTKVENNDGTLTVTFERHGLLKLKLQVDVPISYPLESTLWKVLQNNTTVPEQTVEEEIKIHVAKRQHQNGISACLGFIEARWIDLGDTLFQNFLPETKKFSPPMEDQAAKLEALDKYDRYIIKTGDTIASITLFSGMDKMEFRSVNRIHTTGELWSGRVVLVTKKQLPTPESSPIGSPIAHSPLLPKATPKTTEQPSPPVTKQTSHDIQPDVTRARSKTIAVSNLRSRPTLRDSGSSKTQSSKPVDVQPITTTNNPPEADKKSPPPLHPRSSRNLGTSSPVVETAIPSYRPGDHPEPRSKYDLKAIFGAMSGPGGLEIKNRTWFFKTYPNCFVGKEAVDWLIEKKFAQSRPEAVSIGKQIAAKGRIVHVSRDNDFEDKDFYYNLVTGQGSRSRSVSRELCTKRASVLGPSPPPPSTTTAPQPQPPQEPKVTITETPNLAPAQRPVRKITPEMKILRDRKATPEKPSKKISFPRDVGSLTTDSPLSESPIDLLMSGRYRSLQPKNTDRRGSINVKKLMTLVDPNTKGCTKGFLEITPNEITFSPNDSMKSYSRTNSGLFVVIDLCSISECIYYSGGADLETIVSNTEAFLLINCSENDSKKKSTYYFMGKKELVQRLVNELQDLINQKKEAGLRKRLNIDTSVPPPLPPRTASPKPAESFLDDDDEYGVMIGKSQIISTPQQRVIRSYLPERFRDSNWKCLFATSIDGTSLQTFYNRAKICEETILIIQTTEGQVFGGFTTTNWKIMPLFYGDGECFVFSVLPLPAVYKATHSNECFMISNSTMIGMGGDASGRHALYLNDELHWGTSEVVTTYLNRRLSGTEEFQCAEDELWGLGSWEEDSP